MRGRALTVVAALVAAGALYGAGRAQGRASADLAPMAASLARVEAHVLEDRLCRIAAGRAVEVWRGGLAADTKLERRAALADFREAMWRLEVAVSR